MRDWWEQAVLEWRWRQRGWQLWAGTQAGGRSPWLVCGGQVGRQVRKRGILGWVACQQAELRMALGPASQRGQAGVLRGLRRGIPGRVRDGASSSGENGRTVSACLFPSLDDLCSFRKERWAVGMEGGRGLHRDLM